VTWVGGVIVTLVAFAAGVSGFGFALFATPLLLLTGFSLPFVVTANLLIGVATRVTVAARLRDSVSPRRVALLMAGVVPGLLLGAWLLESVGSTALKMLAGAVVVAAASALAYAERHPPRASRPGAPPLAGFLGGVLATTTSLSGVPPALLLARERLLARNFMADMALYFILSGAIGLLVLALTGAFSGEAARTVLYWLPGLLLANSLGMTVGLRLPARAFRFTALAVAFVAGVLTIATA
jgi:uncharacterized membrane protein YfcA